MPGGNLRFYGSIRRVDEEQRMVWGYAGTEARASDGMIITRDALSAALSDYMKFANVREMHQKSAVGVTRDATVDDKGLYIGAHVVDDVAWGKVKAGVYKGFSIGGAVTRRDDSDKTIVRGLTINEISLVDRPADPESVFDVWRSARPPATASTGKVARPAGPAIALTQDQIHDALAGMTSAERAMVLTRASLQCPVRMPWSRENRAAT